MPRRLVVLLVMVAVVAGLGSACGGEAGVAAGDASSTTTTAKAGGKPTTTKPGTKPTTTKPGAKPAPGKSTTTTTAIKSKKDGDPEFCAWVKVRLGLMQSNRTNGFKKAFDDFDEATQKVRDHFPAELSADYAVFEKALDKVRPVVESGEVSNLTSFTQWFARNDGKLYDQVATSLTTTGNYGKAHC